MSSKRHCHPLDLSRQVKIALIDPNKLVAHRGDPFNFPENTLVSIKSAAESGAVWAEVDIQYTADFIPVLYHDSSLRRVSGDHRELITTTWEDVEQLRASCPKQFGAEFNSIPISTFTQLLDSLPAWPKLRIFVELKSDSIHHFGADRVIRDIIKKINNANCHNQIAAIISKHDWAMEFVRMESELPIGWVMPDFTDANLARAQKVNFDFLFINQTRFTAWKDGLPRGSEGRIVYTINDLKTAQEFLNAGADMVETDLIKKLIGQID